jgi:hypothetical protein
MEFYIPCDWHVLQNDRNQSRTFLIDSLGIQSVEWRSAVYTVQVYSLLRGSC